MSLNVGKKKKKQTNKQTKNSALDLRCVEQVRYRADIHIGEVVLVCCDRFKQAIY